MLIDPLLHVELMLADALMMPPPSRQKAHVELENQRRRDALLFVAKVRLRYLNLRTLCIVWMSARQSLMSVQVAAMLDEYIE